SRACPSGATACPPATTASTSPTRTRSPCSTPTTRAAAPGRPATPSSPAGTITSPWRRSASRATVPAASSSACPAPPSRRWSRRAGGCPSERLGELAGVGGRALEQAADELALPGVPDAEEDRGRREGRAGERGRDEEAEPAAGPQDEGERPGR